MSLSTFLIQYPITHPRKVTCALLFLTLLSTILFLSHTQRSTTALLSKGPPWEKLLHAEQSMVTQDILTVGILPYSEKADVFTPTALSFIISIDQALQSFATVTSSSPQIIANDYLAPGNIDLATPGGLGAIKLTPFLDATLDTPQLTETTAKRALQSPLLSNTFVSKDGKAIALRLPCLISGQTQVIQQRLQHATVNKKPEHPQLFFAGLSFARENFFREMQKNILPLASVSLALIVTLSLLLVFPSGYSGTVILPVSCSTSLILALQTLVQLPADIFSFIPPLTAACTSLLFSIWLMAFLNSRLPEKEDTQPTFVKQEMKRLVPQLWLISLASGGSLFCLCFSTLSTVRFLGCFAALAVLFAFIITVMAVPATLILLPSFWLSKTNNLSKISRGVATLSKYTTQSTLPGKLAYSCAKHWPATVTLHTLFIVLGITGIMLTTIGVTPVQWYAKNHWIPTANQKNIQHFAGVDQLNLVFSAPAAKDRSLSEVQQWLTAMLKNAFDEAPSFYTTLEQDIEQTTGHLDSAIELSNRLTGLWRQKMNALLLEDDVQINRWSIALDILSQLENEKQTFLMPAVLVYLTDLQKHLGQIPQIGKSLSVADIVQSTHQGLFEGSPEYKRIPTTIGSVDQTLAAFKEKRPMHYLARFITADATQTTLTLYLKNSSPNAIETISQAAASYFKTRPPPVPLDYYWTGPAYGFKIWNEKAVYSLFFWATVGLMVGCLIFAITRHSLTYGLSVFAVTAYILTCTYGLYGLLGIHLGAFTMAAVTILIPVAFTLSSMMLHSLSKTVQEYGCWHGNRELPFLANSFPLTWSVAAIAAGCIPALFSAYSLLQTTAFMTISFMFATGITFFTLLPLLSTLLQSTVFKKELLAYHEEKEQAAVTAKQEESSKDTAATMASSADDTVEPELKDAFSPQKNTAAA